MRTETTATASGPRPGSRGQRGIGALAGLLACGAALGVAELLAGVVGGQASPLVAVGGAAIDATPEWLKELAISTFGARDKAEPAKPPAPPGRMVSDHWHRARDERGTDLDQA